MPAFVRKKGEIYDFRFPKSHLKQQLQTSNKRNMAWPVAQGEMSHHVWPFFSKCARHQGPVKQGLQSQEWFWMFEWSNKNLGRSENDFHGKLQTIFSWCWNSRIEKDLQQLETPKNTSPQKKAEEFNCSSCMKFKHFITKAQIFISAISHLPLE